MKRYVILAGVNGAGKSTLFSVLSSLGGLEKINLDETARELGDWWDYRAVLQAAKIVVGRMNQYFEEGVSFSQETTLCGKSILRNIQKAKELGYSIEMHYIGLDSPDTAKERVKNRVAHGGHGIPDEDIERRYAETLENLKIVLPQCNLAVLYDNTELFRRFAIYKDGQCMRMSGWVPAWYQE